MASITGINWSLVYRKKIDKLNKDIEKLRRENLLMKRRLAKYEKTMRMVYHYNRKDKNENDNIRTSGNGQDNNIIKLG